MQVRHAPGPGKTELARLDGTGDQALVGKEQHTEFGANRFPNSIGLLVLPAGGRFETTLALTLGEVMKPSNVLTPLPVVSIARTGKH